MSVNLKLKEQYNGFKLISLELKNNTYLGTITFDYIDLEDKQDSIYSTVLIGPNGTGKSNSFWVIIELFKELYDLSKEGKRSHSVDGDFSLRYAQDGSVFEYTTEPKFTKLQNLVSKTKAYLFKNGKEIDFKDVLMPEAIVANSIMLTDKYPLFNDPKLFPIYKYLGIRFRAQNASTRYYVRKTVEFIAEQLDSIPFRNSLKKITEFLGLENKIDIIYYTSNTTLFFDGKLDPKKLKKYFLDIKKRYDDTSSTPPFKVNSYISLSKDDNLINDICNYCNNLFDKKFLEKIPRSSSKFLRYDIINDKSFQKLKKDYEMLENLRLLGLLLPPEIKLQRNSNYELKESSSGEYHFFSAMIGLMATVKSNSLVFIDEPEVSLHPNWQMQYMSFLHQLFSGKEFASSHIVLATHSHFIISDLKADNSKIIGLNRTDKIEIVDLPKNLDTYGWSAENVLYNVFNVVTSRNKFVAETIANILEELSKGNQIVENKLSKEKYNTLLQLQKSLKNDDPLKDVVNSIIKQIK